MVDDVGEINLDGLLILPPVSNEKNYHVVVEDLGDLELPEDVVRSLVNDYRTGLCDIDGGIKPSYSSGLEAFYKIQGAKDSFGKRMVLPGLFYGRFVDAIAYAVQQSEFYPDYCETLNDSRSQNAGYIELVKFEHEDLIRLKKRDYLSS